MSAADEPLDWGTSRELTPLETIMWRADTDPGMRSTVTALELLDTTPDWDRLVAAHEWASRMVPRFRDRVVEPLGPLGTPQWVRDPQLDLHYHLRRVRLPGDGGLSDLLGLAEQVAMTPFDRARPPWEAMLVEGLPGGRAAYLLKLPHALTDGLGLTQLLAQLHSRRRAHTPDKPQPAVASVPVAGAAEHLTRQVRHDLAAVPATVRGGGGALLRGLRDPVGALCRSTRYAASARRVLSPHPTAGSPLLAPRSPSWRFVGVDVALPDLRAAAKEAAGSVNDAYVAALLAAFRVYHEGKGVAVAPGADMPVSVPVSVRHDDDGAGGNHFAPARLAGPYGIRDARERIAVVRERMRAARGEPALESAVYVAPLLARLPASWMISLAGPTTAGNDLQASNVPGVREELFLAGARIERIYPFAPLPGCAAMISMYTHGDVCCVGANLDAAAVTDPGLFAGCLDQGFREVLALHPSSAKPEVLA